MSVFLLLVLGLLLVAGLGLGACYRGALRDVAAHRAVVRAAVEKAAAPHVGPRLPGQREGER